MEDRTITALMGNTPEYVDRSSWKFWEGPNLESVHHGVKLSIYKPGKTPTIVVEITIGDLPPVVMRMSVSEFAVLNDLFKRAHFKLERL